MEELLNLDLSENTIKAMMEMCPNIKYISSKEIENKVYLLENINCTYSQIRNIISSNPNYLDKTNDEVITLINKLSSLGLDNLNILLDSNPYILNLESFEIDEYINKRLKEEHLKDIVEDLNTNPYLFSEM